MSLRRYNWFRLGHNMLGDMAFIIVPVLTLWNIVPLMYYDLYNRITRFYCRVMVKSLNKEHKRRHFSLKFYYEQFLRITNVQVSTRVFWFNLWFYIKKLERFGRI